MWQKNLIKKASISFVKHSGSTEDMQKVAKNKYLPTRISQHVLPDIVSQLSLFSEQNKTLFKDLFSSDILLLNSASALEEQVSRITSTTVKLNIKTRQVYIKIIKHLFWPVKMTFKSPAMIKIPFKFLKASLGCSLQIITWSLSLSPQMGFNFVRLNLVGEQLCASL